LTASCLVVVIIIFVIFNHSLYSPTPTHISGNPEPFGFDIAMIIMIRALQKCINLSWE
jgi:hypothetical protein